MSLTPEQQRALTEDLVSLTYEELRHIARNYFRNHRPGLTLRPTEVVDEACMQLIERSQENWQNSQHFRAIAARKIWQVIVDEIRKRQAKKRGGAPQQRPDAGDPDATTAATADQRWRRVPLDTITVAWHNREIELIDLADALDELAEKHNRLREVVKLHWFGGLTYADTATELGVSASTVEKDFRYALAWLNRRLSGAQGHGD